MPIVHYYIPLNYSMATTATVATINPIVFLKDNVTAEEEEGGSVGCKTGVIGVVGDTGFSGVRVGMFVGLSAVGAGTPDKIGISVGAGTPDKIGISVGAGTPDKIGISVGVSTPARIGISVGASVIVPWR